MCDFNLYVMVFVGIVGGYLLRQFNSDFHQQGWLVPLAMGGLLSTLMMLLPAAQKGSPLALLSGYLVVGLLILNALTLFALSRLPGVSFPFKSTGIEQTGRWLLPVMGVGLSVLLKKVLSWIIVLAGIILKLAGIIASLLFQLIVMLMAGLSSPSRRQPYLLSPQIP